jgi:hypothetical protein
MTLLLRPWPLLLLALAAPTAAWAQVSRTVYKCEVAGKTVYTDAPCLGAQRVDVEPTRGMNKGTGKELIGKDVARERSHEMLADAIKPVTGMDDGQLRTYERRAKLSPESRLECRALDGRIRNTEALEQVARADERAGIQQSLLASRQRHKTLGC